MVLRMKKASERTPNSKVERTIIVQIRQLVLYVVNCVGIQLPYEV